MTALHITQYFLAAMALATIVASEALSWGLSGATMMLLAGVAGWLGAKRPSELRKAH